MEKKPVSQVLDEEFAQYRSKMREIHGEQLLEGKTVVALMRSAFDYGAGVGMQVVVDELRTSKSEVKQSVNHTEEQETLHNGGKEPGGSIPQE